VLIATRLTPRSHDRPGDPHGRSRRSTRATAERLTDVVAGERPDVAAHLGARPATRKPSHG